MVSSCMCGITVAYGGQRYGTPAAVSFPAFKLTDCILRAHDTAEQSYVDFLLGQHAAIPPKSVGFKCRFRCRAELLTQASRLMMLDIVRIVFARLPGLPPSAPRPDSDALHPLRNGPPAIPAGESLIEHSPAEPDTGQRQHQQEQQSHGEPDAAPGGDGETKPLLNRAAEAQPAQNDAPPAAAAAASASQPQLPRPDSTGWNAAGALAPYILPAKKARQCEPPL